MYSIKHVNRRKHFLRLKVQIIYGNIAAIFNKYIMYPTSETQMWVTSVVCMNEQEIICITIYGYSVYNIVRHILTYKGKITKKKPIAQRHYYKQLHFFHIFYQNLRTSNVQYNIT